MSQFKLSKGKIDVPEFFILCGVEGIGKTKFASDSPGAVIVDIEGGSKQIDVNRIDEDQLQTTANVISAINFLAESSDAKTIVIDSISRLEKIIWNEVSVEHGKKNIEDIGYAKGYIYALDKWEKLLNTCKNAVNKGKNVIIIAHIVQKVFNDPTLVEGYSRYELEIHHKAASLLKKNVDGIYFANYKVLVKDGRGLDTGERCLYTERRAGHDAKNRFGLPYEIKLDWNEYAKAKKGSVIDKDAIIRQINGMLSEISNVEIKEKIESALSGDHSVSELQAYLARVEEIIEAQNA